MAETPSSVSSELSSHSDNEFPSEMPPESSPPHSGGGSQATISDHENDELLSARPAKRRRTARARTPASRSSPIPPPLPQSPGTDVSSDSEASFTIENPKTPYQKEIAEDEFTVAAELETVCRWDGCNVGKLENHNVLVAHIFDDHAGQAKPRGAYKCEWVDCKHKSRSQMSAYALRAHMRTHTKEKPFMCDLPECDGCFTRSDALQKHIRTLHGHENPIISASYSKQPKVKDPHAAVIKDAATPTSTSSPAPKADLDAKAGAPNNEENQSAAARPQKLKLVLNASSKSSPSTPDITNGAVAAPQTPLSPSQRDEVFGAFPPDLEFESEELTMPRHKLFRLLRRQIRWAEEDGELLQKEIKELEKQRLKEWQQKELLLTNLMEAEAAIAEETGTLANMRERSRGKILEYIDKDAKELPLIGDVPWYRKEGRARGQVAPTAELNGGPEPAANKKLAPAEVDGNETEEMEDAPGEEA